jgi:hypothetical protein
MALRRSLWRSERLLRDSHRVGLSRRACPVSHAGAKFARMTQIIPAPATVNTDAASAEEARR